MQASKPPAGEPPSSFTIGSFKIQNALLTCRFKGQVYRLPFNLSVVTKDGAWDRLECCLTLYPHEQEVTLLTQISLSHKTISLNFRSHAFQLNKLTGIAPYLPGLLLSGAADIEGDATIQLEPFKITNLATACELRDAQIQYNQIVIAGLHDTEKGESPIRVEISGEDTQFRMRASNVSCVSPAHVLMPALQCDLRLTQGGIECAGYIEVASCDVDKGAYLPFADTGDLPQHGKVFCNVFQNGRMGLLLFEQSPFRNGGFNANGMQGAIKRLRRCLKTPTVTISGNGENAQWRRPARHSIRRTSW